ncbi:MOSC domain-containing protein [Halarcobacter ebronensis]|uniref:MOSC domain-containing protein n=1 Tax=Halarcobacter ebronensis TaxID=1462615 RepID=A0A4Q0YHQ4_9BACT|nr:MOSC domain-containing protein [Halarcobacter ebronensis]QKF82108.1 MOSC domain-containing protein [Halarcobacter ebronensis]RXJ70177.1 MOSC domain-containing protein [Halarcobacter ebronensis]RXK04063.1 MOSC domain-containing protein [Halarcobacter ebronensis]
MYLGKVIATFSAKKGQSGLPRPKVDDLNLIFGFGIEHDKFAGKDVDKAVMIVGKYSYDYAKANGIELEYGSLGENILFDFNPHDFPIGTEFKIGETVLQITENCTICNHLAVFDDDLPILLKECRGLYCKIKVGGKISEDLSVKILEDKKIAS